MLNLAEKYTKQIEILLKEIKGLSVMSKIFSKLDISLVEEDNEAPKVHEVYGSTLNILSNLFGAKIATKFLAFRILFFKSLSKDEIPVL